MEILMVLSGATSLGPSTCTSSAFQPTSLRTVVSLAPASLAKKPWHRGSHGVLLFRLEEEKKTRRRKENLGNGGTWFSIRAQAEVESAAEFEAGFGADESERRVWSGEQDSKKAKALGESTVYPIMRVYAGDLCSLEVTGDVKAWKAVEAMAADGGATAAEELSKGRSLMTVETIIPGGRNNHSTVSTKLLAPTHLVTERAKTLWTYKKTNVSSGNALARSFEKVVMQNLLSFDIRVYSPGSFRDMANLANEKEDEAISSLESRDSRVLEGLAEVVSAYSISNIKDNFYTKLSGKRKEGKRFVFWRKSEWIWALNNAIGICPLSETEIWEYARTIIDEPNSIRIVKRSHQTWWPPSNSVLQSSVFQENALNGWATEFIPIHKIQIDTRKVKVSTQGWQTTKTDGILELHLTHAQLVELAGMLDLYFEDPYTTPAKTLRTGVELTVSHLSKSYQDFIYCGVVSLSRRSCACWPARCE